MERPEFDVQPGYEGEGHIPYAQRLASQSQLGLALLEGESSSSENHFELIGEMLSRKAWGHRQTVAERILDEDYPVIGGIEPGELVDVADYLSTVAEGVRQTGEPLNEEDEDYVLAADLHEAFSKVADQHRHRYTADL